MKQLIAQSIKKGVISRLKSTSMFIIIIFVCCLTDAQANDVDDEAKLIQELIESDLIDFENLVKNGSQKQSHDGFATYYANKHSGKKTTSGQRYNPEKYTAAHPWFPLGTVVRVYNKITDKYVIVTVNDRCAPKSYHFIDISRVAAEKIGIIGKGRTKVVITPLFDNHLKNNA